MFVLRKFRGVNVGLPQYSQSIMNKNARESALVERHISLEHLATMDKMYTAEAVKNAMVLSICL